MSSIQFYLHLHMPFDKTYSHNAALQKSGCRALMSKPEMTLAKKLQREEETLGGSKFKREPILSWTTPDIYI